jgi:hypothetical protein
MPEWKAGDRVLVRGQHRWAGQYGTIKRVDRQKDMPPYVVALDNALTVRCDFSDLQRSPTNL